jgi:glycosyltransferase involved in cell wall biosynthesis
MSAVVLPKKVERRYFVTLGTIEGRKNHRLLLRVWQKLVAKWGAEAPILIVIGQRGWEADEAISILDNLRELQQHVRELRGCDDDDVASWIAGARGLLMPSFVEGFGLPVVEALQLNVRVIATDLPVYHEIAGDVPTYLDPKDPLAWERAIEDFLIDGPEWSRQGRELQGFRAPNWPGHFTTVEGWLEQFQPAIATAA